MLKKAVAFLIVFLMAVGTVALTVSAADDFSAVLATFPTSYQASLKALHEAHPSWKFERVSVGKNFQSALEAEHNCKSKLNLVEVSSEKDARACQSDCKNAAYHSLVDGVYRCASYDYIAECMDPTNYLRESFIFQFEYLGDKSYYTKDRLETALQATSSFMQNKTCTVDKKTYYYSQIILDACKENGVDALFIISRITNEVGSANPAKLAKGYAYEYEKGKTKTVYNFFNIGGNVTGSAKYAYNRAWTNPKAALEGGIKFIAQNYIKAGQYTNYFQKFQVNPDCSYGFYEHQYMQGADAVINEAGYTFNNYSKLKLLEKEHVFKIPVYENLSKVSYEAQDLSFKNASFSESYAFVNAQVSSNLAVRTEPSTTTGYAKCRIARSTLLKVSGKSGIWYKVQVLTGNYKGQTGYCHGDYVSPAQKLYVAKDSSLSLQPKLRVSTCTYSSAYASVKDAVTIKNSTASGKKLGTCVFKVTSSSGNTGFLEIECTGAIDAPVFTLVGGNKQVKISWSKVADAAYYCVYTYDAATKKLSKLLQTTETAYTHISLKEGTEYTYLVRAFDVNGGGSKYAQSDYQTAITIAKKPSFSLSAGSNSITAKWSKVGGAEKYGVWSYNASTGKYTKLGETDALQYKVTSLKANTRYTYIVKSHNASGWSPIKKADCKSIKTAPKAPVVSASGGSRQVKLSWGKCAGAKCYRIYRFNTSANAYTKIAQQTGTTKTITKLKDGTEYIYLVRAVNADGTASSYTKDNQMKLKTLCAKPAFKLSCGSDSVSATWSKVKGAERYGIWTYNAKKDTYTKLGSTTNLSYTIKNLKANTDYVYLVRAYNASGWSKRTKEDTKKVKTAPQRPEVTLTALQKGVKLSWKKCAGAVEYKVYTVDTQTNTTKRIQTLKATEYVDVSANGGDQTYLVRAINAAGKHSDYSEENYVSIVAPQ